MSPCASTDADGAETPKGPVHVPVMAREALALLDPRPGQVVVDATCGLLGHTRLLCERLGGEGTAVGIDRDPEILERARETAAAEGVRGRTPRIVLCHAVCHEHIIAPTLSPTLEVK